LYFDYTNQIELHELFIEMYSKRIESAEEIRRLRPKEIRVIRKKSCNKTYRINTCIVSGIFCFSTICFFFTQSRKGTKALCFLKPVRHAKQGNIRILLPLTFSFFSFFSLSS